MQDNCYSKSAINAAFCKWLTGDACAEIRAWYEFEEYLENYAVYQPLPPSLVLSEEELGALARAQRSDDLTGEERTLITRAQQRLLDAQPPKGE